MAPNPETLNNRRSFMETRKALYRQDLELPENVVKWFMSACLGDRFGSDSWQNSPRRKSKISAFVLDDHCIHPLDNSNKAQPDIWMDTEFQKSAEKVTMSQASEGGCKISWLAGEPDQTFSPVTPEHLNWIVTEGKRHEAGLIDTHVIADMLRGSDPDAREAFFDWFISGLLQASGCSKKWNDEMKQDLLKAFPQIRERRLVSK